MVVYEFAALLDWQHAIGWQIVNDLQMDSQLQSVLEQPFFRVLNLDLNILLYRCVNLRLNMLD